ncbi:MAG TPA: AAA family ATPase [Gemmatimonadaceae bacterium]|nr:AAA family ATPase [Gemmatimonadaceae bacterium]
MTKKPNPGISLRALGDATIATPLTTIDPSAEIIFAAALYLLLERREPISRRSFQAVLWPDASDRTASHRLRQTLLKLRRLGFPIDVAGKGHISLATESVKVDYEDFLATRNGLERSGNDALVLLPAYEPRFSQRYLEWLDTWKADVNASMTRVMLGIIARHRVKGEWVEAERNAAKLLRFQPYNEEATLAMAEACAMRGGKLQAMEILDKYLNEVGSGPTDLRLPATIMRRRIAERMHPRMEAAVGQSPLVGRGAVMEQLGELLRRSRDKKGQSCLVWGDAGVGKSRLLAEFATFASLQGVPTQRVQCRPNDRHRPLSAFVDLVPGLRTMRGAIGCSPETFGYLDRLTKHKPSISESRTSDGDSEFVYSRVQQSLFDLIDAVSEEGCLIVLIEDVHWLDSTSAKLLSEMVAWATDHSIFFALTGRERPEDWARTPGGLTEIHLQPLDTGASKDVILGVVRQQGHEIAEGHLDWCVRVAEGNPYFLQELANHWVETGDQQEIPSSLAAVLNERISRISGEALLLLQTCALLETNATLDRIEKLIGLEAHRMLPAINELGLAGMLVIEADDPAKNSADRLLSRHDLLSNAALARLTPPARAFLHRRAGAVFESEIEGERSASTLWDCARHWQLAGNIGRAFQLAKSCATHLMEVGLPSGAAQAYRKALAYCSTAEETAQILEGQTRAYYRSKDWGGVLEAAARARKVHLSINPSVDRHDDLELMVLRAQWRNMHYSRILEKALRCLNEPNATARHRVEAGIMSLKLLTMTGDMESMRDVYAQVETLATAPDVDLAMQLQAKAIYHTTCGSLETALASTRLLVEEHRKNGHVGDLIRSLNNAAVTLRTAGVFDETESVLLEALSVAKKHKIDLASFGVLAMLAHTALERGGTEDAHHWWELLRASPVPTDDRYSEVELAVISTRVALLSKRPCEAKRFLPRGWGWVRRDPVVFRQTYFACLYVATELACGRIPSDSLLEFLEGAHLRARDLFYQAYPTYALYVGLTAAGKEARGAKLLTEYLSSFRREPHPPSAKLLLGLERLLPLARKKRNGRGSLPAVLSSDRGR